MGGKLLMAVVAVLLLATVGWLAGSGTPAEVADSQWKRLVGSFNEVRRPSLRTPSLVALPDARPSASVAPAADPTPATRPERIELDAETLQQRQDAYAIDKPKNIVQLQRFRVEVESVVQRADGTNGRARLVNLAPGVNVSYVLELTWDDAPPRTYHLSNLEPERRDLGFDPTFAGGIALTDSLGRESCALWGADAVPSLEEASRAPVPYVPLCDGAVSLRLPSQGRKTTLERMADFLRDNIWGGEQLTVFVRETFYRDAFVEMADLADGAPAPSLGLSESPPPALLAPEFSGRGVVPSGLGLPLRGTRDEPLAVGEWYPVAGSLGIWLSVVEPRMLASEILADRRSGLAPLDEVERSALSYLVAFDLAELEIGFALGTDHPRLDWSDRVAESMRHASLAGPDGFDSAAPLIRTGIVPATLTPRIAATFTGGFKRSHGAFKYGDLSQRNHGSHYGFVENGVVYSKLQPGLATLLVTTDGDLQMKTWEPADDALSPRIVSARQNGVPILEHDTDPDAPGVPGALVARYGPGNWSGSQDGRYRTLRAGACRIAAGERGFLVYGYFSGATPSAMARVFEAYGCSYAMLLDMNALEHTYLATYRAEGDSVAVAHLIDGMAVLDQEENGSSRPRFLAFSDNRDFFYVVRRDGGRQ